MHPSPDFACASPRLRTRSSRSPIAATPASTAGRWRQSWCARCRPVEASGPSRTCSVIASIERAPLKIRYFDATITTAPLPSSGGLTLAQALNMLRHVPMANADEDARAHLIVEALRRGFHDRARYLGDPAFVAVPSDQLALRCVRGRACGKHPPRPRDPEQRARLARNRDHGWRQHHAPVDRGCGGQPRRRDAHHQHAASARGIVAGATGVLLNNEMDDFRYRARCVQRLPTA